MPSHLTRHVFRRILASEPILHRGCLRRQQHNGTARRREGAGPRPQLNREHGAQQTQRRTAFNLASMFGKKREPAGASMDPGVEKMMELEKMTRLKARLPPPEQIADALSQFLRPRKDTRRVMSDNQARLAAQSLRYCRRCDSERHMDGTGTLPLISNTMLRNAIRAVLSTKTPTSPHIELGKTLCDIVAESRPADNSLVGQAHLAYVRMLAFSGSPQAALDLVMDYENTQVSTASSAVIDTGRGPANEDHTFDEIDEVSEAQEDTTMIEESNLNASILASVLNGFVMFGPSEQVEAVLAMYQKRTGPEAFIAKTMQGHCLKQNDVHSALHWWHRQRRVSSAAQTDANKWELHRARRDSVFMSRAILDWCLRNDEIEIGHQVVQELAASVPSKPEWDLIFVWAAGTKKSVDEIDRMIGIMVQSNESIEDRAQWRLPDIATINMLVESAISRDDPYMAERFIALGRDKDISPDAKTFDLQMNYRLRVGDIDGALIAYKNLQGLDLSSNEDVPTVNRLIVALCNTQRHDFDTIMNVAADLSDRRARFDADTVATLSLLHLRRDERYDVIDLLNTHAYHFSSSERESIRNALVAFALDDQTPIARSWDTYTILRELFDEMPRTQRTDLMTAFMRRERPDMGVHVFQNMRMHSRADTMPTNDTYVAAFMSLAKMRELDSLEVVHNQLKLDFNVQSSTYLLNALIIAYTACGKPRFALDYWDEIAISREGPSYNSVHVALRACEKAPFGDLKAQEIWSVLRKRGVELDQSLWASYAAALAGNGDNALAFKALEDGVERGEVEVDAFVLGSLFAAGANTEKQAEMEMWAKGRFGEVWEGLVRRGVESNIAGMRWFVGVDRSVAP